jgi:hypothetical protein
MLDAGVDGDDGDAGFLGLVEGIVPAPRVGSTDDDGVMAVSTAAFWASASWTSVVTFTKLTPSSSALASAARASVSQNSLVDEKPEKAMVGASAGGASVGLASSVGLAASVGLASSVAGPQLATSSEATISPSKNTYHIFVVFILFLRLLCLGSISKCRNGILLYVPYDPPPSSF